MNNLMSSLNYKVKFKKNIFVKMIYLSGFLLVVNSVNAMGNSPEKKQTVEEKIKVIEKQLAELKKLLINQQSNIEENVERVDEVENNLTETQDSLDNSFKISSYTDLEYSYSSDNNKSSGIRLHHFSLFLEKQILPNLKFFSETEYEDAPLFEKNTSADGKIYLEAINFTWKVNGHTRIRGGRFFTPSGIWSEDHYPPFVATQDRPLFIRKIFPQVIDGASVFGQYKVASNFINYTLYSGNGEGNTGTGDLNSNKSLGLRTQLIVPALKNSVLGIDYYQDTLNFGGNKSAYGFHGKLKLDNIDIQGEYAKGEITNNSLLNKDMLGYYLQGAYHYNDFSFGYRYDFYDKDRANVVDHKKHNYFINYHLSPLLVLKAEYNDNIIEDQNNYQNLIFSIAGFLK